MAKLFRNKGCDSPFLHQLILLIVIVLIINTLYGKTSEIKGLRTVVIDAGHGGKDPGAVVGKAREKDIVLEIALKLGNMIKEKLPDIKVIYTRQTDVFVPLFERSVIANKINADLFISIHANYCASPSVKGTETYVLGLHRTEDNLNVAKKENSVILLENDYSTRYEGFDPNLSESYIMFELIQNTHIEQSVDFAGILQDSFFTNAQRANRDVRQAGFLVLRETAMPGVLIETGYLSNKSEANYLMTNEGRSTLALSIFNSFNSYKQKFDARLNLASVEPDKVPKEVVKIAPSVQKKTDIKINSQKQPLEEKIIIIDQADVKEDVKSVQKDIDEITFAVQIVAYPRKLPLNSKLFKGITNISEKFIGGYFKYYCLETKSIDMARDTLLSVRVKIPDAFIVAFKNGQPIPIKEAMNVR